MRASGDESGRDPVLGGRSPVVAATSRLTGGPALAGHNTRLQPLRAAAKAVITGMQQLDPSRFALPPRRQVQGSCAFVAVYRTQHVRRVRQLLRHLGPQMTVRLWSLGEPDPDLRDLTVGHGPGVRFTLLNRLVATIPESQRRSGLVVSDDDYRFLVGSVPQLVALGQRFGLDVWQPAHGRNSWINFPFVRRRWGVVLRRTSFVEQGPVLVLSEQAQRALLPFPEDLGMAWGVELRWAKIVAEEDLRLGIVDASSIHHLPPLGDYDREAHGRQLRSMLDAAGLSSMADLQREYSRVGFGDLVRLRSGQVSLP